MKNILLVILLTGTLAAMAAVHENVVFYKDHGCWSSSIPAIPAGQANAGRISWDGKKPLILKAVKNGYDLSKADCISWMMYLQPGQTNVRYNVILTFANGKKYTLEMITHRRPGWNRCIPNQSKMKKIPKETVTAIQFRFATEKTFPVLLDDIRFAPKEINYSYPDDLLPPVTSECFFPEYTTDEVRSRILNAPDFKERMAEIEKLRSSSTFQLKIAKVHSESEQKYFDLIQPDGSVKGYSYDEIMEQHDKYRWVTSRHESYGRGHVNFFRELIHAWQGGYCRRTPENREKFFCAVVRAFSVECNRRGEGNRFVVASFLYPYQANMIYRLFYSEMEAVENGTCKDPLTIRLNRILKECSSWAFAHPDWYVQGDLLTVDSFRHHNAWVGGNFGYRPVFFSALVCRNPGMLDVSSKVAAGALLSHTSYNTQQSVFWKDGLCADGSAWGHGEQNYLFDYPFSGILCAVQLISQLKGTSWEINCSGEVIDSLLNYMEATLWYGFTYAPRKKLKLKLLQRDIPAACGRIGLRWRSPNFAFADFAGMLTLINETRPLLKEGTPQRQRLENCYAAMTGNAPLPTGARYFWNNDLLICRQKSSAAVISMLSKRVRSMESAPSASFFTDFWSDGSAWIMKHPDTYRIARGFFHPCAIPGVTARQWNFTHSGTLWRTYRGLINFAGGATDGDYALCAYRMDRERFPATGPEFYNLEARKAYFWFNGELVCLGSGITDRKSMNTPVATTIDQTEWRGPAVFGIDQTRRTGEKFVARTNLLWHDGVGYAVLKGQGIVSGETRKERWCEFDLSNLKQPNRPKTAPILMLQIDHGKNPKQDSYIYAVHFDLKDFTALQRYAANPSFRVLSNTDDVQAVYHTTSDTFAAVFYKAGSVDGLTVDAPAVVLIRDAGSKPRITVNDPEQNPERKSLRLTWKGKLYTIRLPEGTYCGKPTTVN